MYIWCFINKYIHRMNFSDFLLFSSPVEFVVVFVVVIFKPSSLDTFGNKNHTPKEDHVLSMYVNTQSNITLQIVVK